MIGSRNSLRVVMAVSSLIFAAAHAATQNAPAPGYGASVEPSFTVDLVPVASTGLPPLHSFAVGTANQRWLIFGGRTNGLHLFVRSSGNGDVPPPNAFPTSLANNLIFVIEPATQKVWSATLPPAYADQMAATNPEFYQDGDTLYVMGGYGIDRTKQQMVTFGELLAVQVSETIDAIVNGKPFDGFIQQISTFANCADTTALQACIGGINCKAGSGYTACMQQGTANCNLQAKQTQEKCVSCAASGANPASCTSATTNLYAMITGGGLIKSDDLFYAVFGQQMQGLYSVLQGDYGKWPIQQIYTQRIVSMYLRPSPLSGTVLRVIQQDPNDSTAPYNRRDLNTAAALNPENGAGRVAAYGGVFVPGRDQAYQQPIYIDNPGNWEDAKVTVDKSYEQRMNQYTCPTLKMFDRKAAPGGNMITIFFGGISLYYYDRKTLKFRLDQGLPFSRDLSVLIQSQGGAYSEFVRNESLGQLMGTNAEFIQDHSVTAASNGVIYLDALKTKTRVGYFYGGIVSKEPETGGDPSLTSATNALYEIWVTPTSPQDYWVPVATN
jgi:hypothetical protein